MLQSPDSMLGPKFNLHQLQRKRNGRTNSEIGYLDSYVQIGDLKGFSGDISYSWLK